MATPFDFKEQKHTEYNHSVRVYICGADVTQYLTSSVSVSYADRAGINMCNFSLSNAERIFEITDENLGVGTPNNKEVFRMVPPNSPFGIYSEEPKFRIYNYKKKNNTSHAIKSFGPVETKTSATMGASGRILGQARDASKSESAGTNRYPLVAGSLVFHKYDPVRVFILNPLPGAAADTQQWVNVFTGYLDVKPYSQDYVTGYSVINITCQDIRTLMQQMRTQINPSSQVGNENSLEFRGGKKNQISDSASAGFFNDLIPQNAQISHVLGGFSFKQSINFLIFGVEAKTKPTSLIDNNTANTRTNLGSVGKLKQGKTFKYTPGDKKAAITLEEWNNLVIFGTAGRFLTEAEMVAVGEGTTPTGEHSPDAQAVHYLWPFSGAPISNLVEFDRNASPTTKADWSTRLELLVQLCKNIDYQFYVTGSGDIVFEFPMYDFLPSNYGPSYAALYTFDSHNVKDNVNDEGGSPISALIVNSSYLQGELNKGNATVPGTVSVATPIELTRTIFSNVLASRIGVHVETHSVPGVRNQNTLTQLGMIEFAKRLSDFDKFDMSPTYRPYIGVNRPMHNVVKRRLGCTTSVTSAWTIRESVTIQFNLSFTRKQENDGKFRFISGGEALPISYNVIYDPSQVHVVGQGVGVIGGDVKK